MDWTKSIATEVETGEATIMSEEELERLEALADDNANAQYDARND